MKAYFRLVSACAAISSLALVACGASERTGQDEALTATGQSIVVDNNVIVEAPTGGAREQVSTGTSFSIYPAGRTAHVAGSLDLGQRVVPINTDSVAVYAVGPSSGSYSSTCVPYMSPQYLQNAFPTAGIYLLHSEHNPMNKVVMNGCLLQPQYTLSNVQLSYDAAHNQVAYAFDVNIPENAFANSYEFFDYKIVVNAQERADYWTRHIPYKLDLNTRTFQVEGAYDWVDVHYTIGKAVPQNFRMQKGANGVFTQTVFEDMQYGDAVNVWFTYAKDGRAQDTLANQPYTLPAVPPEFSTYIDLWGPRNEFYVAANSYIGDVSMLYNIKSTDGSTSATQLVSMEPGQYANGARFMYTFPAQITNGQTVNYKFIYVKFGRRVESDWQSIVHFGEQQ